MFNYLVTSRSGAWNLGFYEWDKSRILEFTESGISLDFEKLGQKEMEVVRNYPCLFAYEGSKEPLKVGRITSFTIRATTILIEFVFDDEIPEIPFSSISTIFELLDIRKWELSRTHWAIKNADLLERLRQYNLIPERAKKLKGITKPEVLPPREKHKKPLTSLQQFVAAVLRRKYAEGEEVFYRGHSSRSRYKLEPSLFRKDPQGNYIYLPREHLLYRELLVSNAADFSGDTSTLDRLVRMQHFSLPTRLFDITSNPLIALYFACKSNPDEDGEVIVFVVKSEHVKYFDSDTAGCIANLARLPRATDEDIKFPVLKPREKLTEAAITAFNQQPVMKRLVHFICEEKPFFEPKVNPNDLKRIICVKGKKTNDRISFQSGAFLLFGLDAKLNETGDKDVRIARFRIAEKRRILKDLDAPNINESTVFPYIENSAKYVAERFKFKKPGA